MGLEELADLGGTGEVGRTVLVARRLAAESGTDFFDAVVSLRVPKPVSASV